MGQFLNMIDAAPAAEKWPLVRRLMMRERETFFAEMRAERPVLELPDNIAFITRYADCTMVLQRWHDFGVDLYKPKQGDYFMAQDDTADHWRDKSIMKSILDFEDLPELRSFVGQEAARILRDARGAIDAPQQLTRMVPCKLVQERFGFTGSDPRKLITWSYWNQTDAFHNQPFDRDVISDPDHVVAERKKAGIHLALYLGRVMIARWLQLKLHRNRNDSVTRLMRLSASKGVKFPLKKVLFNAGGLLIGTIETTSVTVNNALDELLRRPDMLARARAAAANPDHTEFDGYVVEALRFNPAFPYFFRTCHTPTQLAGGTPHAVTVQPGTTVIACTHSAMFDGEAYADATVFDPRRTMYQTFTLGYGHHECLGRAIATIMIPEIVRQLLLLPNLRAEGSVVYQYGVPEHFPLRWDA
ncbi:cytochrome P450 [Sphingomonas parva]|uniref:Cytochrome P450 n=1 Tax=Sphingomonas parva TaxID=2555898 RepID=A0A4Y8ZW70_9SPHN|nr:cytochrome P450 [Sphingomonas parva]TFI58949.1 cytochrome P450 [Sphingomonas parva]